MRRSKIIVFTASFLSMLSAVIVFTPRNHPTWIKSDFPGHNLIFSVLYLSGPLERVGNFFLLVPFFAVISILFANLKKRVIALICFVVSAIIELAQIWIPGRVSSTADFLRNSAGIVFVVSALGLWKWISRKFKGKQN